jgi:hypothetical protein
MENPASRMVHVPKGVPIARFVPPPQLEVPAGAELPILSNDSSPEKKLQELWGAKVGIFNLSDPEQLAAYERVWQLITDKQGAACEHRIDFYEGKYSALLRWIIFEYKLPKA